MQSVVTVIEPAKSVGLISLMEIKTALNIIGDSRNAMLEQLIERVGDEIATLCNRVLAKERVVEAITEVPDFSRRLYLDRYPVKLDDIYSVSENGTDMAIGNYRVDSQKGVLHAVAGSFAGDVVIEYSGGYALPAEAPPALRQASIIFMREAYYAALRGDPSIVSASHKNSNIRFSDPNRRSGGGGGGSEGSPQYRAVKSLLSKYTRYHI